MTQYWNPTTGLWESREELGERPATAETVIASEGPAMIEFRPDPPRLPRIYDWATPDNPEGIPPA